MALTAAEKRAHRAQAATEQRKVSAKPKPTVGSVDVLSRERSPNSMTVTVGKGDARRSWLQHWKMMMTQMRR